MADCLYHGYSGGPGDCYFCKREKELGLKQGKLRDGYDYIHAEDANISSVGRSASKKLFRKKKTIKG